MGFLDLLDRQRIYIIKCKKSTKRIFEFKLWSVPLGQKKSVRNGDTLTITGSWEKLIIWSQKNVPMNLWDTACRASDTEKDQTFTHWSEQTKDLLYHKMLIKWSFILKMQAAFSTKEFHCITFYPRLDSGGAKEVRHSSRDGRLTLSRIGHN